MLKSHVMLRLLNHGPLTRAEMREITGWDDKQVKSIIQYLSSNGKIFSKDLYWHLGVHEGLREPRMVAEIQSQG